MSVSLVTLTKIHQLDPLPADLKKKIFLRKKKVLKNNFILKKLFYFEKKILRTKSEYVNKTEFLFPYNWTP